MLYTFVDGVLGARRLLLAGAELGSRNSEIVPDCCCKWVRATENAPRGPFRVLERRHGVAEIVERGAGVFVKRASVIRPHPERDLRIVAENTSRHWPHLAQQWFGFFETR